jgi:hypothetical protein
MKSCKLCFNVLLATIWFACGLGAQTSTNPPPPGFATRLDYLKTLTNEAAIANAYKDGFISKDEAALAFSNRLSKLHFSSESELHKAYERGLIGKGEAMSLQMQNENAQPQDFYGKIVDQYGQPVAGVAVTGSVELMKGLTVGKIETYKTQTDAEGLFQFTGLKGASLSASISKPGYEINYGVGRKGPVGQQSSPTDRIIFTMWKLRGAEPMIQNEFDSRIPYDGTAAAFNLATGKKTADGDLKITLSRSPLKIRRGRDKFDWAVKIEMLNGGIVEENDPYPNWAPEKGYKPFFDVNMSSNNIPWSGELRQNFYFKNARKQYGRLFIDLSTDSMHPDTGITIQTLINPSGSQNLEFDPKKQIR